MFFKKKENPKPKFLSCSRECPDIFNEYGERMFTWYMDDPCTNHTPYSLNAAYFPKYVYLDRYNSSLKDRFFAHNSIFENHDDGFTHNDYALLYESEAIIPDIYKRLIENRNVALNYKYIFTPSKCILDEFENARFIPGNGYWYGSSFQGGGLDKERYNKKTKNVSIISSNKCLCEAHRIRLSLAKKLKDNSEVDAYGSFGGIDLPLKADALDEYRYSIVIENDFTPFYFTEKILDCFASQTVPIYMGALNIEEFFNIDGIIKISKSDVENIEDIIRKCNEADYMDRKEAIIDNYNRVLNYRNIEDYIIKNYEL